MQPDSGPAVTPLAAQEKLSAPDVVWTAVVNDLGQYSIWPADRELPDGWSAVGDPGTRESCLEYIGRVWTDIVPRRA